MTEQSFEEFAHRELPRLTRLARLLTGNDHDGADLVQDTLMHIGLRWARIDHARNPSAYASRCLVTKNLDRLRKLKREILTHTAVDRVHNDEPMLMLDAWVDEALQAMTGRQRAAVVLAYLDDLSVDEIARALDCSPSAVKTHLSRGRAALQRASARRAATASANPAKDQTDEH